MTVYQWLCVMGVPAILSSIIGYLIGCIKKQHKESKALAKGVQALLRAQMLAEHEKWMAKGYCPIWAKQNFENMWVQYEALWENGVMGGVHEDIMHLPNSKDEKDGI